jgi:hypothetical protein
VEGSRLIGFIFAIFQGLVVGVHHNPHVNIQSCKKIFKIPNDEVRGTLVITQIADEDYQEDDEIGDQQWMIIGSLKETKTSKVKLSLQLF